MDVVIDSADRETGTSVNFQIDLPYKITNSSSVTLLSCALPHTFYNIRTGVNDMLDFDDGAVLAVTIPGGGYAIADLLTEIQTQMNSVSTNFVCAYSSVTLRITISRTIGTFSLLCNSGANSSTSIFSTLGYTGADTPVGASAVATNTFDITRPRHVLISVDQFSNNVFTTGNSSGTFIIPMNGNYGDVIYYEPDEKYVITFPQSRDFSRLTFRLFEADGSFASLNGGNFQIVLRF